MWSYNIGPEFGIETNIKSRNTNKLTVYNRPGQLWSRPAGIPEELPTVNLFHQSVPLTKCTLKQTGTVLFLHTEVGSVYTIVLSLSIPPLSLSFKHSLCINTWPHFQCVFVTVALLKTQWLLKRRDIKTIIIIIILKFNKLLEFIIIILNNSVLLPSVETV